MEAKQLEDEFIRLCASPTIDEKRANRVEELLYSGMDWHYVIDVTTRNKIRPLIYYNISSLQHLKVSERDLQYLKQYYLYNIKVNLLLKAELVRVLRLFQANNVWAMPVKGPLLAETVYGNIALREAGDLDILVNEAHYASAVELLMGLDYKLATESEYGKRIPKFAHGHHQKFLNTQKRIVLELHWELIERYRGMIPVKSIPPILITTTDFGGITVPTFQPEFHLLYLCVHGSKHKWERLSWLCDVAKLLDKNSNLEWAVVLNWAAKYHLENILALTLDLAASVFECPIPNTVLSKLANDRKIVDFSRKVETCFFAATLPVDTKEDAMADYFSFNYALLSDPIQKIRFITNVALGRIAFTPNERDKEWIRLPQKLEFIYYIIRPVRMIRQYSIQYLKTLYRLFRT